LNLPEGGDQRIERMLSAIEVPGVDTVQRQLFHYALFREYDRIQQIDKAWLHLSTASALRRKEIAHSTEIENRCFDALIDATQDVATVAQDDVESPITPIFILGMPRTGTSLLEKILGNFPRVQPCGELTVFRNQLLWQLDQNMQTPFDFSLAKKMAQIDFRQLGQRYLEKISWRNHDASYLIDKEPFNYNFAGLIARALPNAKIIHLMRNPMDTCFSNFKEGFASQQCTYSYTQEELASHYINYRRLMRHWHQLAPGRILDVHYENLVTRPEQEAERIRAFCELQDRANHVEAEHRKYVSSTLSSIQLLEPIHDKNIHAWRRYEDHLGVLKELLANEQEYYQRLLDR
ncbi:MAG: sulfotransferase family protein, partial [Arenimonas sp.]